jgi:Zn-dependent protease
MSGWWVHEYFHTGGAALLVSWIFWVICSITLHELAHGWAALWQGDDTPRTQQRLTINPLVHMGPMSLLMFALVGIAWGVMPVDPSRFRWRRRGRIVVAGAGPAMNIAIALITLTAAALWLQYGVDRQPLKENIFLFFITGGWLNIVLAAFNLLPIPPLDGSSILMGLSFRFYNLFQQPQIQMIGFFIMVVILMSGGGGLIFSAAGGVARAYVFGLARWLP